MNVQSEINKAQTIKRFIETLEKEKELPIGERRSLDFIDKQIMKACIAYDKIYVKLTKDAKRNRWSIRDFEVNDYFDYETFDYDVSYL